MKLNLSNFRGWVIVCFALMLAPLEARAQTDATIEELRTLLRKHPEDVDVRLKLATLLSWRGKRQEARDHVWTIIKQTPHYWDAQLLLARLDAWDKKYNSAYERVIRVIRHLPDPSTARELLLNIAVWSEKPRLARKIIKRLLDSENTAELNYQMAEVEKQDLNFFSAYRYAKRALQLNPLHKGARELVDSTRLVELDLAYEIEAFPSLERSNEKWGHGLYVTATWLPRSWLSATLLEEYHYRYAAHNLSHKLQLMWRITHAINLQLLGGFAAPNEVLFALNIGASVQFPLTTYLDGVVAYQYDQLPWGGSLYRPRLQLGLQLPRGFTAEGALILGMFARCGGVDFLPGTTLRGSWEKPPYHFTVIYGFGDELDSLTNVSPFEKGWRKFYTEEGCIDPDIPPPPKGIYLYNKWPVPLLRSHEIALIVQYQLNRRLLLRGAYSLGVRFTKWDTLNERHVVQIGVRTYF